MKNMDFYNKKVIIDGPSGIYCDTRANFFREFGADECTSPRGVESRFFVQSDEDGHYLMTWGKPTRSFARQVESFSSEEEAELALLRVMEEDCANNNSLCYVFFETYEEAETKLRDAFGDDFDEVVKESLIEAKRELES